MVPGFPTGIVQRLCRVGRFVAVTVLCVTSIPVLTHAQGASSAKTHVDSQRLQGTLEKLSEFGRNPEGGVTRIGFSETDMAAREYVIGLMKGAGLEVRVDAAGNIFGRREGSEKLPVLMFGSNFDSVSRAGYFVGCFGSMDAIEVMRSLNDGKVKTRHPLEAVIWTN